MFFCSFFYEFYIQDTAVAEAGEAASRAVGAADTVRAAVDPCAMAEAVAVSAAAWEEARAVEAEGADPTRYESYLKLGFISRYVRIFFG